MKNNEILSFLTSEKINELYPYLSLPNEWVPELKVLGSIILENDDLREYFLKASHYFTEDETPNFSDWEIPVVQGTKRHDFFLFLSLIAVETIQKRHSALSIPMEITKETCLGVGTKSRDFFFFNQKPGTFLRNLYWFRHHMDGRLYKVGRFEFMLKKASVVHETLPEHIGGDGWILDMHIPGGGAMDVATAYDSWKRALDFFDTYFPDKKVKAVVCVSWIFSTDLCDFLDPQSNLVKLIHEVNAYPVDFEDNDTMVGYNFIMGTMSTKLDDWPEKTSLQRAFKKHIREGGKVQAGAMHISRDKILSFA